MRIRILLRFGDGSPLKATRAKHCSPKTFSYCKAELARRKGLSDRAIIAPATLTQDAMRMTKSIKGDVWFTLPYDEWFSSLLQKEPFCREREQCRGLVGSW